MGTEAELRDQHGQPVRGLADPAGGTFDAAGDFDALLPQAPDALPNPQQADNSLLGQVNPYGNTVFLPEQMVDLLHDIEIARLQATTWRQQRGLERLGVLAEVCRASTHLAICFVGTDPILLPPARPKTSDFGTTCVPSNAHAAEAERAGHALCATVPSPLARKRQTGTRRTGAGADGR